LAVLAITGVTLAVVQLDRVDALWTTRYGIVLSCKLCAVAALLALAAVNRYALVPRFEAVGGTAARPLAGSIAVELTIAIAILGLVALWRFTPPPRSLALAGPQVSIHFHGERAMAQIEVASVRGRGAHVSLEVLDGELRPLAAKEVTLAFSNPAAGIEPVRRTAVSEGGPLWDVDDLRIPIAGRWRLRVEILIDDFDKVVLEDDVELPRSP
jgi:copper transport protein